MPEKLIGIFDTLAAEHREAAAVMAKIIATPAERFALWPMCRAALVSHEQGEMRELFPVLRGRPDLRDVADHHDSEAHLLDELITQLDTLPLVNELWMAVFTKLAATVKAHVAEEESTIFPAAQDRLGADRCLQLDLKYRDAKAKLVVGHQAPPREPHATPVIRA